MDADDDKFLKCAEAVGIVYEAEGHRLHPGPVESVVMEIRELKYAAERWREFRKHCYDAAVILESAIGHVKDCAVSFNKNADCTCVIGAAHDGNMKEVVRTLLTKLGE